MFDRIGDLLLVIEEGSVNRAARRLGIAQPTLSRQIQSLEQEIGGSLFERDARGMKPTDLCFYVRDRFKSVISEYELAKADIQAFALGRHWQIRIGYIGLAAARFLNPSLAKLRKEFPELKLHLLDQTPGEQLELLKEGQLDVAIVGQETVALTEEFYSRRAAKLGVCAVLSSTHPLAGYNELSLCDLSEDAFIGVDEQSVPGRNQWIRDCCQKAGFKPRILVKTREVSETFTRVASEGYVALLPGYVEGAALPGTAIVRVKDRGVSWSLYVLRQRGRGASAARRLVEILCEN